MEITVTTTHKVMFAIELFENSEGGMIYDSFRENISTIQEAIVQLETAKTAYPERDWVITVKVETVIKGRTS